MYTAAAGSIVELRLIAELDDQTVMNTFHYVIDDMTTDGGGDLAAFALAWDTDLGESIRSRQTVDLHNRRIEAQFIDPIRFVAYKVDCIHTDGADVEAKLPTGCAVVCRRTTDLASRKGRGRVFFPGVVATDVLDSELTGLAQAGWLANAASKFATSYAGIGGFLNFNPVIWSHTHAIDRTPIVAGSVDTAVRYQRRREVGRGI